MNDNNDNTIVLDSTNRNHNGVWQHGNTSSDSVSGKINRALNFNGTSDNIVIDSHADFNNSTFSFCAWLKHTSAAGNWDRVLSKKSTYSATNGYEITLNNTADSTLWVSGSSGSFATSALQFNWTDQLWHHIVVVYIGSTLRIYADGVNKTYSGSIASVVSNTQPLKLGPNVDDANTYWRGAMDDIRYYNIALSQSQVTSIYNNGLGTEIPTDLVSSIVLSSNY